MSAVELQKQCYSSSLNLLKPIDLIFKLIQQVIDLLICEIEWAVGLLSDNEFLPKRESPTSNLLLSNLRSEFQEGIYNVVDVPHVLIDSIINLIRFLRMILWKLINFYIRLISRPICFILDFTLHELNLLVQAIQPFIPIPLPKFTLPFGDPDSIQFSIVQLCLDFGQKLQPYLPFSLTNPFGNLAGRFPHASGAGSKISNLEKYNKELIDLIEKERQSHYDSLSKLSSLEKDGSKANELLDQSKHEYDSLKQNLLLKIAEEIQQHKEDVEQLTLQAHKDKIDAEDKLAQAINDCNKQKQELLAKFDKLTLYNKNTIEDYEDKLQQKESEITKYTLELSEKGETERKLKDELDQAKAENETQKNSFFEKMAKERDSHQSEIQEVLVLRRTDKTKSDEKIAQLTSDITTQKQTFLAQIDSERKDCTKRIEKYKSENDSDKTIAEGSLSKANETLLAEKQALVDQMSKEREQYKIEIDKLAAKSREDNAGSEARIQQLTKDLETQKKELLSNIEKERQSTQAQIQSALNTQKTNCDLQVANMSDQVLALQSKNDELQRTIDKSKGFFGSLTNKPTDTTTSPGPLQDTGYGKIFKPSY